MAKNFNGGQSFPGDIQNIVSVSPPIAAEAPLSASTDLTHLTKNSPILFPALQPLFSNSVNDPSVLDGLARAGLRPLTCLARSRKSGVRRH